MQVLDASFGAFFFGWGGAGVDRSGAGSEHPKEVPK